MTFRPNNDASINSIGQVLTDGQWVHIARDCATCLSTKAASYGDASGWYCTTCWLNRKGAA